MTAPLTLEEIDALAEAEAAATPGPWCVHPNGTSAWRGENYEPNSMATADHLLNASSVRLDERFAVANIELTVEARNALPVLLSMARRLVELESALAFLCEQDAMVEVPDPSNEDGDTGDTSCCCPEAPALVEMAKSLGWTPPKGESE